MSLNELLTPFGKQLEKAVQTRTELKEYVKKESISRGLKKNSFRLEQTRSLLSNSERTVIVGPGPISNNDLRFLMKLQEKKDVVLIYSQWADFRECLEPQILASCHVNPLMASLMSSKPPTTVIQGAYVSSPPVLSKSFVIRWSDPFLSLGIDNVTPDILISKNSRTLSGEQPHMYIPRNSLFFCLFSAIFLGSKNISLVGFDPNRPEYHFSRDEEKKLQIAKCLLKSNPWISAWDGRFERITKAKRISEHRLLERVAETLAPSPKSAVGDGWRLEEMKRGVDLTLKICQKLDLKINYFGESIFMRNCGLKSLY